MARTDTQERADRVAQMEEAFQMAPEAPVAHLPAVTQTVIDDRPTGAIDVKVKRDLNQVMLDIRKIASAAGTDFYYSWTTTNKDGTKGVVEGPSVKCANAISRIYGNCVVQVRPQDIGTHWILHARFIDLQTGYVYERPFQQRKGQNVGGKMDKDRAADIVFQIGVSKAARNVVCNALSEFTDYAVDIAKEKMVETIGKRLPAYKAKVEERLGEMQVELKRAEAVRGKPLASWTAYDVAKTISEIQTVSDGMAHPDDVWPPMEKGAARPKPEDFKEEPAAEDAKSTEKKPEPDPRPAGKGKGSAETKSAESPPADSADQAKGPASEGTPANAGPDAEEEAPVDDAEPAAAAADPEPAADDQKPATEPASAASAAQEPPAEEKAVEINPAAENAAEIAAAAFERAESWLAGQIESFGNISGKDGATRLETLKSQLMDHIRGWADMDPEDAAVLLGRLNTAYLERMRFLSRHKR